MYPCAFVSLAEIIEQFYWDGVLLYNFFTSEDDTTGELLLLSVLFSYIGFCKINYLLLFRKNLKSLNLF